MKKNILITIILFLTFVNVAIAKIKSEVILTTNDIIWGITFLNDNEILFTEREGKIKYHNIKKNKTISLASPKVTANGQGGLLDIYFKEINSIPYVYYTFSNQVADTITTSLGRAQFLNKQLKNHEVLFNSKVISNTTRHFGSRIHLTDKYLFMTVGDRGERKYAQDLTVHNGKILRLNLDGSSAKGNPFENKKGALSEIWSYGHRNPQGLSLSKDGTLYSCEFGPRGGDELNVIIKGHNYGWPIITYGKEYWGPSIGTQRKEGLDQPLVYWTPSISPSGMLVYESAKNQAWQGSIFLAALGSKHLRRLSVKNGKVLKQEVLLKELGERIRQVKASPSGDIYLTTDSGKLIKITDL